MDEKKTHGRDTSYRCLCGAETVRDEKHDAYYCPESGVWMEAACEDPECEFCPGRPELRVSGSADGSL